MKRSTIIPGLVLFILLLSIQCATDQPAVLPHADPVEIGLDPQGLEQITTMLKGHIDSGELAGAVALIARKGSIGYHEAFGYLDLETQIPMPPDAIFRLASMTKLFTSLAALKLHVEGRFELDEPIAKYVPELAELKVAIFPETGQSTLEELETEPAQAPITIRDIMRHTAGFTYGSRYSPLNELYAAAGFRPWEGDMTGFAEALAQIPQAYHPGTNWEYSYATDILGLMVERISGQSLRACLEETIWQPLGLKDADFLVPPAKLNRFPVLYEFADSQLVAVETVGDSDFRTLPPVFSGGGGWDDDGWAGMVGTAEEYAVVLQMILNRGVWNGTRILQAETIDLLLTNQLEGIPNNWLGDGVGFGLGTALLLDPTAGDFLGTAGEFWWAGSCNTYFFADPGKELLGVLMLQVFPFGHLGLMGTFEDLAQAAVAPE